MQSHVQDCLSVEGHKCVQLVTFVSSSCSYDLDLDPMTLIYEPVLHILKMGLYTKNEVSRSRLSKVRTQTGQTHTDAQTQRHTDRQTRPNALPAAFAGCNKRRVSRWPTWYTTFCTISWLQTSAGISCHELDIWPFDFKTLSLLSEIKFSRVWSLLL